MINLFDNKKAPKSFFRGLDGPFFVGGFLDFSLFNRYRYGVILMKESITMALGTSIEFRVGRFSLPKSPVDPSRIIHRIEGSNPVRVIPFLGHTWIPRDCNLDFHISSISILPDDMKSWKPRPQTPGPPGPFHRCINRWIWVFVRLLAVDFRCFFVDVALVVF